MKAFLTAVIVAISAFSALAQTNAKPDSELTDSELEKRYEIVEVWVEGRSKVNFLREITSLPDGICMESLIKMGYPHGNKIPYIKSNRFLVTTRNIPDFQKPDSYQKLKAKNVSVDEKKWEPILKSKLQVAGTIEGQFLPMFIRSLEQNDTKEFDRILEKLNQQYGRYGPNKSGILEAYKVYQENIKNFSKDDVLSALYFAEDVKVVTAAAFIAYNYMKTEDDLFDFLAVTLLRRDHFIGAALEAVFEKNKGKINWSKNLSLLHSLVNYPKPYNSIEMLQRLDKAGYSKKKMQSLLPGDLISMKEILKSKVTIEEKTYVIAFLNKYLNDDVIVSDSEYWLKKLGGSTGE